MIQIMCNKNHLFNKLIYIVYSWTFILRMMLKYKLVTYLNSIYLLKTECGIFYYETIDKNGDMERFF